MDFDNVFRNLTRAETTQAECWYKRLREPEQPRVLETVNAINQLRLDVSPVDGNRFPPADYRNLALIVAGSSINTYSYTDIDLFLLSQNSLYGGGEIADFDIIMQRVFDEMPDFVRMGGYGINPKNARDVERKTGHRDPEMIFNEQDGAVITLSLFYKMRGFDQRREGELYDLLEPERNGESGAEQVMRFNRNMQSMFLPLSRQYSFFSGSSD